MNEKETYIVCVTKIYSKEIKVFAEKDPMLLPWKELGIDLGGILYGQAESEVFIDEDGKTGNA